MDKLIAGGAINNILLLYPYKILRYSYGITKTLIIPLYIISYIYKFVNVLYCEHFVNSQIHLEVRFLLFVISLNELKNGLESL